VYLGHKEAIFELWTLITRITTMNRWTIFTLVLVAAAMASGERKTRGLVDEVGKMWSNVFNTGIDSFQQATMREVSMPRFVSNQ